MSSFIRLHNLLTKSSLIKPLNKYFCYPKPKCLCTKPLDVNTNVGKDVILFKYDNPRFFKVINIFAACQFLFWSYLSVFSYTTLKDAPVDPNKDTSWWRKINLGENKYRNGIAILSFIIGN